LQGHQNRSFPLRKFKKNLSKQGEGSPWPSLTLPFPFFPSSPFNSNTMLKKLEWSNEGTCDFVYPKMETILCSVSAKFDFLYAKTVRFQVYRQLLWGLGQQVGNRFTHFKFLKLNSCSYVVGLQFVSQVWAYILGFCCNCEKMGFCCDCQKVGFQNLKSKRIEFFPILIPIPKSNFDSIKAPILSFQHKQCIKNKIKRIEN